MKHIPVHRLNDRSAIGMDIRYTSEDEFRKEGAKLSELGAHRDDYYMFFIMESGSASIVIDFKEVHIPPKSIFYILPGQVHYGIKVRNASGWYMAVDTVLIPKDFRAVFEDRLILQQPYCLEDDHCQECQLLMQLLLTQFNKSTDSAFYMQRLTSLLKSFLGMAASGFLDKEEGLQRASRPAQIVQQFKRLLTAQVHTVKQPSAYAEQLNITESYLNEVLKKSTGLSVTYWITNEIMLEAKRLLYYSDLNVKQIAHQLGYEDHTYFSRVFKKTVNVTPLSFREGYRN